MVLVVGCSAFENHIEPVDVAEHVGFAFHGELFYGDVSVGSGHVARTVPISFGVEGFSVGYQRGAPVTDAYETPFAIDQAVLTGRCFTLLSSPAVRPGAGVDQTLPELVRLEQATHMHQIRSALHNRSSIELRVAMLALMNRMERRR